MHSAIRKDIRINLKEFSGAMGDFGTLIPLMAGYIVVCGLSPASLLVTVGLVSIITGIVFKLPVPIEPMKVLAVVAIAQSWTPSMVYASGFAMGVVWLILALAGLIEKIVHYTPKPVIRGIQVALGVMLAMQAFDLLSSWWLLGILAVIIALLLKNNRYVPGILLLMILGIAVAFYQGLPDQATVISFTLPEITVFDPGELWTVMLMAGFAQIPLTAANAVLSTSSLISSYWPGQRAEPKKLSLSIGLANLGLPFLGGMPICHGAGGLAAKYYFGARTGGANIAIGIAEILCGLFLATQVAIIFAYFPEAIIGAMLILIGFELIKFARDVNRNWEIAPFAITVLLSVIFNMAIGFLSGIVSFYLIRYLYKPAQKAD